MAKIKKESSEGTQKVKRTEEHAVVPKEGKKKYKLTVWDHHDTMIVNLRMWVDKELENLRNDIAEHTPAIMGRPSLEAAFVKAKDLNLQLWDQIRIIQETADSAPVKKV